MAMILERLRSAPPPTNTQRPLHPGTPPLPHLPLNPIAYLTAAIDSVAPLLRIRAQKGAAGGGMALQIPEPHSVRQRRRPAIQWIIDAASKKRSRGSGRTMVRRLLVYAYASPLYSPTLLFSERTTFLHMLSPFHYDTDPHCTT